MLQFLNHKRLSDKAHDFGSIATSKHTQSRALFPTTCSRPPCLRTDTETRVPGEIDAYVRRHPHAIGNIALGLLSVGALTPRHLAVITGTGHHGAHAPLVGALLANVLAALDLDLTLLNKDVLALKRRDKEERRREKKAKRKEKKDRKEKKKSKAGKSGAVTGQWGQYGIINESDLYNKDAEFRTWLVEECKLNPETMSKDATKKQFAKFVEDYNTATLPHEKFYNIDAYERRMNLIRNGETLPINDSYDLSADLAAHTSRHKRAAVEHDSYLNREQLIELRRVQNERIEAGKMKAMGLEVKANMGVRMDTTYE
ncbi:hypothetical protein FRC12_002880 [Ceratobasidium sp. 428]|nr:hypothetical protein FRC12_002880 [Ceratobasidium sp. 428]